MKLGELEFKADEFYKGDPSPRILREKLEKAPLVFGTEDAEGFEMVSIPGVEDTHLARLVCIERMKK